MNLAQLATGKVAFIKEIRFCEENKPLGNRLEAMGIIPNKPITVLRKAWFKGPLHIRIGATTEIAIRYKEAQNIIIQES